MTIRGLSGSLLSHEALAGSEMHSPSQSANEACGPTAKRHLQTWYASVRLSLGPTASARTVLDVVALPLAEHLGYEAILTNPVGIAPYVVLRTKGHDIAVLLVTPWGEDPDRVWRDGIKCGIAHDVRWCLCVNGPAVRVFDGRRAYSRRFVEFDLTTVFDDETSAAVFCALLRAPSMRPSDGTPALDRAVELSERHRASVRNSLKAGVHEALIELGSAFLARGRERAALSAIDESLTVIYRVLFLLFAEARGLVPRWHPTYQHSYTLESLRSAVEATGTSHGLWEALQAIARLAHRGCRAGSLRVPPFNGRLFSPAEAPLADTLRLDDGAVKRALLALTTRQTRDHRDRIAYADLGVEQLGAVYEHVLDYVVTGSSTPGRLELRRGGFRKATGTFYTPRSLTEYLVRRTLAPLVDAATPETILTLRILDPSMGSGAFLVAACRYMAQAYEHALVRAQGLTPADISAADRTAFRRLIAQRCLYGVDLNPMAVQLARLSLWLATLAGDRPLTFLDHHLRCGDSLIGASLADIHRQPPAERGRRRPAPLPLFPVNDLESELQAVVAPRLALAEDGDDTLEQVKHKERTLAGLTGDGAPLARWKLAADLWCAAWFVESSNGRVCVSLIQEALSGRSILPTQISQPLFNEARATASARRFFHWTLEFPEVFFDTTGRPLAEPGFDVILGNPPWEMLRADRQAHGAGVSHTAVDLVRFARHSGVYALQGTGHSNLYQLFVERALSLVRRHGRLGLIVPAGLGSDQGSAALRRELLDRTAIDTFAVCDNRDAIFPIHRSVKFTLMTSTKGGHTSLLPLRTGIRTPAMLDDLPDTGTDASAVPVPRSVLTRVTGDLAAIPEIRSGSDLELLARISFAHLPLGDPQGWSARFGRELNATDDRPFFCSGGSGLPIVEGKHLQPFKVDLRHPQFTILHTDATRILPSAPFDSPRLGYRDVASATNRLTLIAAIVPARAVSTHTVFCLKTPLDLTAQHFLCAIFNSFIANYLVRMRVSTHVTTAVIEQLPAPKPARADPAFGELAALAQQLSADDRPDLRARHQALAAALYGLDVAAFSHVLEGFPLVSRCEREQALEMFRCIVGSEGLEPSGVDSSRTA